MAINYFCTAKRMQISQRLDIDNVTKIYRQSLPNIYLQYLSSIFALSSERTNLRDFIEESSNVRNNKWLILKLKTDHLFYFNYLQLFSHSIFFFSLQIIQIFVVFTNCLENILVFFSFCM